MAAPPQLLVNLNHIPFHFLPTITNMPDGRYGISYDVFTNPTQHLPPNGWGAPRGQHDALFVRQVTDRDAARTYARLINFLTAAGFIHHQYSDRVHERCSAMYAYMTMVRLRRMQPYSKLATTLKAIKMHYIPVWNICEHAEQLQLGGFYAPGLEGPAPRALTIRLDQNLQAVGHPGIPWGMIQVPPPFVRPQDTSNTPQANNVQNWVR